MGSMIGRAGKHAPEGCRCEDLQEVRERCKRARQRPAVVTLHLSILEDAGSPRSTGVDVANRQLGLSAMLERWDRPHV